jgi:hypothetical protein
MQCKGRLTEILERSGFQQPMLEDNVSWEDLSRICRDELSCISIPAQRILKKSEVILEHNVVVNLNDLFLGRLNGDPISDQILQSQENVRTISLTAQSRGQTELLRN